MQVYAAFDYQLAQISIASRRCPSTWTTDLVQPAVHLDPAFLAAAAVVVVDFDACSANNDNDGGEDGPCVETYYVEDVTLAYETMCKLRSTYTNLYPQHPKRVFDLLLRAYMCLIKDSRWTFGSFTSSSPRTTRLGLFSTVQSRLEPDETHMGVCGILLELSISTRAAVTTTAPTSPTTRSDDQSEIIDTRTGGASVYGSSSNSNKLLLGPARFISTRSSSISTVTANVVLETSEPTTITSGEWTATSTDHTITATYISVHSNYIKSRGLPAGTRLVATHKFGQDVVSGCV